MRRNGARTRGSRPFSFDTIGGYLYDGAMNDRPHTPLLDTVDVPADFRKLQPEVLRQYTDALRAAMNQAVRRPGGLLGTGHGAVTRNHSLHDLFAPHRDNN